MLKRKADTRVELRHPKRIVYLSLKDKENSGFSNSSTGDDVQDSEAFPTSFLPPSSQRDQPSSPLHKEDKFELPVTSCARACGRENPGCGCLEEREDQEAMVEEVAMGLVEMLEVMVTMMLVTTMASEEGKGLEVLAENADLQVYVVVEAGKMVVEIMVEEVVVIQLMITMTTDQNTEIGVNSGCTT